MSLQKRLHSGEFLVLAEMDTPKGVDISELVTNARRIKGRVDAVVIPDMANGVMRMSALAGAVLMQQQGLEAVVQICPRDRNRLALQGDLLATHVLGVQNIVVTPGDEMTLGDHIDAKPVNDLDEKTLLDTVRTLMGGTDMAGIELQGAPGFTVGGIMSPWVDDAGLEAELERMRAMVAAGVQYVITPPVFSVATCDRLAEKAKDLGVPLIPTVMLIKSVGAARYMAANIPGSDISEDLIARVRKSPDRVQELVKIAGETLAALKDKSAGVLIQTLGWEFKLPAILDVAGL